MSSRVWSMPSTNACFWSILWSIYVHWSLSTVYKSACFNSLSLNRQHNLLICHLSEVNQLALLRFILGSIIASLSLHFTNEACIKPIVFLHILYLWHLKFHLVFVLHLYLIPNILFRILWQFLPVLLMRLPLLTLRVCCIAWALCLCLSAGT